MPLDALYGHWDLEMPDIPERSHFYSLKPVGIGTPQVESLSSYVARLAEAHGVSVGDLVGREPLSNARSGLYKRTTFFRLTRPRAHDFSRCCPRHQRDVPEGTEVDSCFSECDPSSRPS